MSIEITRNDFEKLIPKLKQAFEHAHDLLALELLGNLQENSPQDHGRLAGSWNLSKRSSLLSIVGTPVVYAMVQNEGSDPYMIYPRRARALRFKVDGKIVFAKEVLHPGIAGTHYIDASIVQAESRIEDFVRIALKEKGIS